MTKNYRSKIIWLILGLVPLLLIACGGGAAAPATDEPVFPAAVPVVAEAMQKQRLVLNVILQRSDDAVLCVQSHVYGLIKNGRSHPHLAPSNPAQSVS